MTSNGKKYAVDVDKLGIDWNKQARDIDERVAARAKVTPLVTWRRAVMAAAALLVVGFLGLYTYQTHEVKNGHADYTYVNAIESYDTPTSFRALNGYAEMEDYDATYDTEYDYSTIYY